MGFEGGRWGIVIVISALMIQVFTFGVSGAIGVYNIEFLDYFQASASEVSLVAALNYGAFLGSGPIVSQMMNKFSYRKIALGGSTLVVLGLLTVPFFSNLYMMYLTIGVLVGFGSCCAYIPSHTLSGLYYNKYRSLATGIATSGSGLGFAIMPVLSGLFIEIYAWKGSFIILAGFCLHLFVFSSLLRSPPTMPLNAEEDASNVLLKKDEEAKATNCLRNDSGKTYHESTEEYNTFNSDVNGSMVAVNENTDDNHLLNRNGDTVPQNQGENSQNGLSVIVEKEELPETARHIYIFKNYNFVIYFLNNYFWNASTSMLATFVPEYFRLRDYTIIEVSWLVGCYGFGTFFGGILGGVLGNFKSVNRIFLFILACFLLGVFTLIVPAGESTAYFIITTILIGLSFGVILGLLIVVLADLIGIESLSNGMGYIMLSNGLGTLTGPIFAGILIDSTQSYESSIYLSGAMSLMSGVVMCLIPFRRYLKRFGKTPVAMGVQ